jgi:hypothetical protein
MTWWELSARIGYLLVGDRVVVIERADDPVEVAQDLLVHLDEAALAAGLGGGDELDDLNEVSSGDVVRHRLSRAGDRQLNSCLHIMAITQLRRNTPGRAYYQRKRAAGKSHREALRCLKRRLSDVVYRQLVADAGRDGPGRTHGGDD